MRLFLARHATAAPGHPDELRPLTDQGHDEARALAARLADVGLESVVTSPLLRARETAAAIARATGAHLRIDERLAPGATSQDVLDAVEGAGDVVATVGHQPDCSVIAEAFGAGELSFAPASVVELELP